MTEAVSPSDGDRGPPISDERRSILDMVDDRIASLRKRAERAVDPKPATYAAQCMETLRADIRQGLDHP